MTMHKARFLTPLGFRKSGAPILPIQGGSDTASAAEQQQAPPAEPNVDNSSGFPEARRETPPPPNENNVRSLPPRDEETGQFVSREEHMALIEKARKEEKDKLYGRIEDVQKTVQQLKDERDERQKAEQAAQEQSEQQAREAAESEMSAKELLETKDQEWQQRFSALEKERETERALLEKERQFSVLNEYRTNKVLQHENDILPELRDLVGGNTPEEIDASVTTMVERSSRILEQVTQAGVQSRAAMRGPSVTAPATGPMENQSAHESVSAADIAQMDMATYMKNRDRLMDGLFSQARDQGIYG